MKIGIYGGTFDPIHNGHISIADQVRQELGLDIVYFVVAADPPHKPDPHRTPAALRFRMAEAALAKCTGMKASDIELKREGKSYTADTLKLFHDEYPKAELYFIVGADMLASFHTWSRPEVILSLANLAAVQREGQEEDLSALEKLIEEEFGGNVIVSSITGPELSSTIVRDRVNSAKPIDDIVPFAVEEMIFENLLFFPEELKQIGERLRAMLDPSRFKHTVMTVREAVMLADRYGLDTEKIRLCALLHDCAKLKGEKLEETMSRLGFVPNDDERENPYLIHARLGALSAKEDFGVDDPQILTAIERHTLGDPQMTLFDEVIFLADKLEPTREYRKVKSMRRLAYKDPDAATVAVLRNNAAYTIAHGRTVHASTESTIEALESRIAQKKTKHSSGKRRADTEE